MKIAHFSYIHITATTGAIPWRAMFSKRIVGWLNLQLFGRKNDFREASRITEALVADLQETGADHILFTGDLTGLALDSEFKEAHRLLAPLLGGPGITGIPGNHDFYVADAVKKDTYELLFGPWEQSDLGSPPPIVRLLGDDVALIALRASRVNAFPVAGAMSGSPSLCAVMMSVSRSSLSVIRRSWALRASRLAVDGILDVEKGIESRIPPSQRESRTLS